MIINQILRYYNLFVNVNITLVSLSITKENFWIAVSTQYINFCDSIQALFSHYGIFQVEFFFHKMY